MILEVNHIVQQNFFVLVENTEGFADRNPVDYRWRKDDVRQRDLAIFLFRVVFQEADLDLLRQLRADMVVNTDLIETG